MTAVYVLYEDADRKDARADGIDVATTIDEFVRALERATDNDIACVAGPRALWMFSATNSTLVLSSAQYDFLRALARFRRIYKYRISRLQVLGDIMCVIANSDAEEREELVQAVAQAVTPY